MQQHIERIAKGSSMPRNGKEGILFSFIMSAIMIYVMAALNYGVRIGDVGAAAWSYALFDWPLAYVVGMICDLCICTVYLIPYCNQTESCAICASLHRLRLVSGSQGSSSTG